MQHYIQAGPDMERDLLVATIGVDSEHRFAIELIPAAPPENHHHDLRFALHYYARVLYLLARAEGVKSDLPTLVDLLIRTSIERGTDIFMEVGLDGSLVPSVKEPIVEFQLALKSSRTRECELVGDIPLSNWALTHSVFAVLQYLADRLPERSLTTLTFGLENMNASYSTVYRPCDPTGQFDVPDRAYRALTARHF